MAYALHRFFKFKIINKYPTKKNNTFQIIDMYDLWEQNACKSDVIISSMSKRYYSQELYSYLYYFYTTKQWRDAFNYCKRLWLKKLKKNVTRKRLPAFRSAS